MTSVRELRHTLAAALAEEGRSKEALEQLEAAFTERGKAPTTAELYLASGRLHETLGDTALAFEAYLNSVTDSPASGDAATAALHLLKIGADLTPGPRAAKAVQAAVAETQHPASTALLLAGRLLHHAGDLDGASAVFEQALAGKLTDETAAIDELVDVLLESERLADARRVVDGYRACSPEAEGWLLLEEGHFDQALALAERAEAANSQGSPTDAVRLLAMTALDRAEEALACEERLTGSADVQFARLVAHLALQQYEMAREVGEEVARSVGTEPIALMIRAQILLEMAGSSDSPPDGYEIIEEARRSIYRVRRASRAGRADSGARVLRHRWIRLQRSVRVHDDRFQYALAEAIVALDKDASRRRAAVAECRLMGTTYVQDAAARELAVQVLDTSLDSPEEQAEAYNAAASALVPYNQVERARELAQRAVEVAPTPESRFNLADLAWRSSYLQTVEEAARVEHLEAALRLLAGSGNVPADTASRPAYFHGLLLARLGELRDEGGGLQSLPYLLAASLATDDAFRWTNLAVTLNGLAARASALACSQRASAISPDDAYVTETYLISEVNHLADLELTASAVARIPEKDKDISWCTSVQFVTALLNGQESEVRELLTEVQTQESWARWNVFQAEVLLGRLEAASDRLAAFADELEGSENDLEMLAAARRLLGQFDAADDAISRAMRTSKPPRPRDEAQARAKTALVRNPSAGSEAILAGQLADEVSPSELLGAIHVELPLLGRQRPDVQPAIARLRQVAESRLQEVRRSPPRLIDDFTVQGDQSEHAALTRQLLELVELEFSANWETLADRIDDLGAGTAAVGADGFLSAALAEARAGVTRRVVEAVTELLLNRALAENQVDRWADRIERWNTVLDDGDLRQARVAVWWATQDDDRRTARRAPISDDVSAPVAAELLAGRFVSLAIAGDVTDACEAYTAGLEFGSESPFDDWVAAAMTSSEAYPPVDSVLDILERDGQATTEFRGAVAATRRQISLRLGELLGLDSLGTTAEQQLVTPIFVDLGTELVPLVDPSQDDNVFIGELIPQLKDRVFKTTGVHLPGIRLRSDPGLPPDRFVVEVDEISVVRGSIPLADEFIVRPVSPEDPPATGMPAAEFTPHLTRFHPLTGEPGAWAVTSVAEGQSDGEARLSPPQLLAHAIEQALRPHLARFLGPQGMSALVDEWSRIGDLDEVSAVVPDRDARLALTWVLQAVVREGLSIADWSEILSAIRDAGGLQAPGSALVDAIRARLSRDSYHAAELLGLKVPAEYENAVLDGAERGAGTLGQARNQLLAWVRQRRAENGPLLTLITSSPAARAAVSAIIRSEFELIQTVCGTDVAP
jgi:tetratricopeptide (TPR) repeat protein